MFQFLLHFFKPPFNIKNGKFATKKMTSRDRGLINSNTNSNSYFFRITFSQPKIRIKIPKLLAKTMQKRNNGANANLDQPKEKKIKWGKVGSIFSRVFNTNKSTKTYSQIQRNDHITSDHLKNVQSDFAISPDHESLSSKSHSFKRLLEIEDEEEQRTPNKEKRPDNLAEKSLKVSSISRLFHRSTSYNSIRDKFNTIDTSNCQNNIVGRCAEASSTSDNLPRVPSRTLTTRRKLKMGHQSLTSRQLNGEKSEKEDRGGEELCKKRILMGEKCKPLNYSGTLQYDEEGILLPDVIP